MAKSAILYGEAAFSIAEAAREIEWIERYALPPKGPSGMEYVFCWTKHSIQAGFFEVIPLQVRCES